MPPEESMPSAAPTADLVRLPPASLVLAAIAALAPGDHLATDADNTIWAGDVGDEVVRLAATPPHTPWQAGQADFAAYLHLMETEYQRGCQHAAELLATVSAQDAESPLTQAILARVRPRRWLVEALQQAIARGVHVWLVSASPRLAVELGARCFGLQGSHVIAVDCLGPGEFVEPVPVGEGKVGAWQALGLPMPDVALGDSWWDLPLLASAREGFLLTRACDDPTCDQALTEVATGS